jgi:serine/threonine protein kinase
VENYQGQLLDYRYLVEEIIGRGGMGVVYRGKHVAVGRPVAIKFLSAEFSSQEEIVKRFYREAQTAASIGHKNIVDILDVGVSDRGEPYFVMEYLEGECLSSLIQRIGPLNLSTSLGIMEPVLLAMAAAHGKGIVHRDLKPDNVFLVHDRVDNSITIKLIDFGISKFLDMNESDKLTRVGSALGTPCYMSPEQVSCSFEVDHRSDIYTIGVLLFEMLTGDTPHVGTGHQETMIKILTEPPRNPSDINPYFPEEARPIIERAMAPNPIYRYQSAMEMLNDIRRLGDFQERVQKLSNAATGISEKQCAVGDLGRVIGDDENSDVSKKIFTELSSASIRISPDANRRSLGALLKDRRFWWATAVFTVILVGVFMIATSRGNDPAYNTVIPVSSNDSSVAIQPHQAAPEGPKEIRIDVRGAPPRSTIYYDDVLVPSNKFYVPVGNDRTKLMVEAPGYESFRTDITPKENLVVDVEMRPGPTRPDKPTAGASGEYLKGRRQTEIVKDFE